MRTQSAAKASASLEGERIGAYEIAARIGAGGMGEIYRARDTRLGRTVAIKVLSAQIANDSHFRDRFEREARAVAALNHPHICTLYDIGEAPVAGRESAASIRFLVMEYLEGESLSSRLARGRVPMEQALRYGAQIASALDKAHRAGIIHRDVKPANVMLTKAGAKLLDFGIARQRTPAGDPDLTGTGVILGTLQYMAPEQLEGKPLDARTDIFALGAVLYEMFSDRKIFDGASQAAVSKSILEHQPSRLPALSHPALDRAVRKCLANDPDDRWQSAGDLASELAWIADTGAAAGVATGSGRGRRQRGAWSAAALGVVAILTAATIWRTGSVPPSAPKRFVIALPDADPGAVGPLPEISLVPDGSGIVYRGRFGREWRLHLQTFADGVSRAIAGTERAGFPFFSPDGEWIGFFQDGRLMKVAIAGGAPMPVCEALIQRGASWGDDDHIVVTMADGLARVPAAGGAPERLTTLAPGETWHTTPQVLPGGHAVIFTALSKSGSTEDAEIAVVSVRTGKRTRLLKGATSARYSPTGHLVYVRNAEVVAVAFDRDRLTVTGTPFLAGPGIRVTPQFLIGHYDFSSDGTLAYVPGAGDDVQRTMVWVDRDGAQTLIPTPPRAYMHPSLLPDERGVIVEIEDTPHNIWHADLTSGTLTPLTREGANHRGVVSPDGRLMAFSSDRTVPRGLFRQPTDGSGAAAQLIQATAAQNATSWSRDGRWLAFTQLDTSTKEDIWILPLDGDQEPRPFLKTGASESSAAFSPDGHWIAYSSDESGHREVFVAAFPGPGARKRVSTDGGDTPVFSADGRTVFYRLRDQVLAAPIVTAPALSVGAARVAFDVPPSPLGSGLPNFAINRKGDALLAVKDSQIGNGTVHVILNWREELKRLVPTR